LRHIIAIVAVVGSLVAGCESLREFNRDQARREAYVAAHPEFSPRVRDSILNAEIRIGFTMRMVNVAWGDNYKREWGEDETGIVHFDYESGSRVTFRNGIVVDVYVTTRPYGQWTSH